MTKHEPPAFTSHHPLVLTVAETCSALRIGKTMAYELIADGRLQTVTIGKSRRVTMESIRALVNGGAANDTKGA